MSTIDDRSIIDRLIADNGRTHQGDPPAVRITEYLNHWGGITWGVVWAGENIDRYQVETDHVRKPQIIWERK